MFCVPVYSTAVSFTVVTWCCALTAVTEEKLRQLNLKSLFETITLCPLQKLSTHTKKKNVIVKTGKVTGNNTDVQNLNVVTFIQTPDGYILVQMIYYIQHMGKCLINSSHTYIYLSIYLSLHSCVKIHQVFFICFFIRDCAR